jgi:hypothetical protein
VITLLLFLGITQFKTDYLSIFNNPMERETKCGYHSTRGNDCTLVVIVCGEETSAQMLKRLADYVDIVAFARSDPLEHGQYPWQ